MDIVLTALIIKLLGFAVAGVAVLTLHARSRTRQSRNLLVSVLAFIGYQIAYIATNSQLARHVSRYFPDQLDLTYGLVAHILPDMIWLIIAITFLQYARSQSVRPNNSFKPRPLRGSA